MKVRVKSVFIDKNTNEKYKLNKELDVSKDRYKEIQKYVEIVKTKKGQE
jgi:hypothetical protein